MTGIPDREKIFLSLGTKKLLFSSVAGGRTELASSELNYI